MELLICSGTGCVGNGSLELIKAFREELKKQKLESKIKIAPSSCHGLCGNGPVILVQPDNIYYQNVTLNDVKDIVNTHCLKGEALIRLMPKEAVKNENIPKLKEIGFFSKQRLVALYNRGVIDPESIDEYIARGGYKGAARALIHMKSEEIIEEIIAAGLRGRGGAGFPTGVKWGLCAKSESDEKYIICNCDEGDPGAFMDRSIMESDPHSVLEGMLIGAKAMGAREGFIYIRSEYPLAIKHFQKAIDDANEYGLLGKDIMNSGTDFKLSIYRGAGAFVCGEETSLIHSLEGVLPEPHGRPPYPAVSGYMGKPTNINNTETWSNVPHILRQGAKWFASIGTEKSKGTKVFSLVGKVKNTGLIEVPMGITLREIVFDIGGGVPNGKKFKAVQTGGPSGGCLPKSLLDISVDYESLQEAGSIMGSGGMIVMDEDTCMVELARYFLSFSLEESCGKCTPCREGTRHMHDILTAITAGEGKEGDIELLEEMGELIKETALCGLGKTAPNPVLTTIKHFRHEYEAHIRDHKCPAKACKNLIKFEVIKENCTGCTLCAKSCPVSAIRGEPKKIHEIDQSICVKCGICRSVCRFNAIGVD
ncbi:MAG: NADH-quinone oxidoreductase subunit NuoF [Spirochaetales bacterium]|nr:NADH-quinone oxidoreductase subunit NuoF [Spirochaetales bacterium]